MLNFSGLLLRWDISFFGDLSLSLARSVTFFCFHCCSCMTSSGITNEAAVLTVSVVNKQTKAAMSSPRRVSLPLSTLRVASLPTLSDAGYMCQDRKKKKNDIIKFVSLLVLLLLVIVLWSFKYSVSLVYSFAVMDWTLVQDVFLHLPGWLLG